MKINALLLTTVLALCSGLASAQERSSELLTGWEFRRDHNIAAADGWQEVRIPHDWAITGPFDRANDLQEVAIVQNNETIANIKTGRSGGLPYMGKGSYRRTIDIDGDALAGGHRYILLFDGAMSEALVLVNGVEVCYWPYGYNSFHCDITDAVRPGSNELAVLLENRPQSSRWYPGAGLYRKVRLLCVPEVHVPVWGTYITTPYVGKDYACVSVKTETEGIGTGEIITLRTVIRDCSGREVASATDTREKAEGMPFEQQLTVEAPELWSPENPVLYTAETQIFTEGSIETDWTGRHKITVTEGTELQDAVTAVFGIRSIEIRPGKGFFLNGEHRKFKGACLHHDLGPLGAAVNRSAIRHQLTMLKDMGCDAIRTSHNMPAEELVELCDEMGFMLMVEPFDEWDVAKCENGYHRFFDEWAEKDMVNMLRHFRNHPSVVMWSIGNEVPSQWTEDGWKTAVFLQDICHREDPTRPVTCGMDQFDAVLGNGFAARLDIAGFNYKVGRYDEALELLPQGLILGAETASTVSSRGRYYLPVRESRKPFHRDFQCSAYDVEYPSWASTPDEEFAGQDDHPFVAGEFVWTGFDYLGEPTPYNETCSSRSSYFGIVDLAGIKKDRYYLYQSRWSDVPVLHLLPHWNWQAGDRVPVHCYTNCCEVELFLNGRSLGRRTKNPAGRLDRYRMIWDDVAYEAGELRAVGYDADGKACSECVVRTAGRPHRLELAPDRAKIRADGEDLSFVEITVVDEKGTPCPDAALPLEVTVRGGRLVALCNGDPTSLECFAGRTMRTFSGKCMAVVSGDTDPGTIRVETAASGLVNGNVEIESF